jgi:tyrosyl-tRNA synthetase
MKVFDDLDGRGLVKQTTNRDKISDLLESESPITFYLGIDPTADSLHVGHLLPLITAKRLMDAGHHPIILIGDATAMVGDPSGKNDSRKMLSQSEIRKNSFAIQLQVMKLFGHPLTDHMNLDFPFTMERNSNWFEGADFLRTMIDIGSHFSVNQMLRAECFKSRLESGLTFLEFSYMMMQAADFNWLHLREDCVLQLGGDDQWSNILAGTDLVRKLHQHEVFGLTLPLLVNSDGTKMGKTERGTVWLDANKTSVFDFFQFWRNVPDSQVLPLFRQLTLLSFQEIMQIPFGMSTEQVNAAKKKLAFEITKLIHGEELAQQALQQAEDLFSKHDASALQALPVPEGTHILDALVMTHFAKSRTDGRNLINNKGITINDEVLTDPTLTLTQSQFGDSLVLRKGKKNFCRLQFIQKDTNESS